MKPGYKTSEFWMSLAASLFGAFTQIHSTGPVTLGTSAATVLPILTYAFSRGLAKSGGGES